MHLLGCCAENIANSVNYANTFNACCTDYHLSLESTELLKNSDYGSRMLFSTRVNRRTTYLGFANVFFTIVKKLLKTIVAFGENLTNIISISFPFFNGGFRLHWTVIVVVPGRLHFIGVVDCFRSAQILGNGENPTNRWSFHLAVRKSFPISAQHERWFKLNDSP